jgi:predicted acylesterase/phospholipase RssA
VLDLREPMNGRGARGRGEEFAEGLRLLDVMDQERDIERRYGFHRIIALVSGPDALELDARIATLGARGVGRVLRDLSTCHLNQACQHLPPRGVFAAYVLQEMARISLHRRPGKRALCLSGGGITGLYFELGALKCLEDCCSPGTLNAFDLYFGISAGGVVSGMLANGYTVTEFMAAIAGERGWRIPPLDLNLLGVSHLDFRGLTAPFRQLLGLAGQGARQLLRGRLPFSLESLVFEYGDLVHAPFNTDGFRSLLEKAFSQEGCTDDFRKLPRALFIGATDQDRKEHVLFGEPPHDTVPISQAIQASMSINPVFAPTAIDGRYYEDGAVTRTSNFVEAIHRGARLIFTVDPLVPFVSKQVGFTRDRGVIYNADQDIRTVSFTRYETTRHFVLRRHPEVSLYTFLPANNLRRVLSVNPMDHRPYLEIWRGAYLGTLRRLHSLGYRLGGDLAFQGIAFDTARADAVAERLEATPAPSFADFFPDGRAAERLAPSA